MLHEEIFPVSESFSDLVPFVDSLDFEGSDVLYGCDGQGAVLQHELDHFMALTKQSVIEGSVPEAGRFFFKCQNVVQGTVKLATLRSRRKTHPKMWKSSSGKAIFCTPGLFLSSLMHTKQG